MPGTATTSAGTVAADAGATPSARAPKTPVQVALLPLAALPLVGWLRRVRRA